MEHGYSATDIVLIIGAIGTLLTSTIAAWKANKSSNKLNVVNDKMSVVQDSQVTTTNKLNDIHDQVNGNLDAAKKQAEYHAQLVEKLRTTVDPSTFALAKVAVDDEMAKVGARRAEDKIKDK